MNLYLFKHIETRTNQINLIRIFQSMATQTLQYLETKGHGLTPLSRKTSH